MKNISDYDFSRISSFLDGELNADEIIHSLVCSFTLMSNNVYKNML